MNAKSPGNVPTSENQLPATDATIAQAPLAVYRHNLESGRFTADDAQRRAVEALQVVYEGLLAQAPHRRRFGRQRLVWPKVTGLYLWGDVGRGKTWLMDTFFEALPFRYKRRTHFHRFMLEVQDTLDHYRDQQDPLLKVARELSAEVRVLCFDEFQVYDIADAMILGRLFNGLFARGVTLVATSNVVPDELYKDGLQRDRFLPAIEALKRNCKVLNVDSGIDYRLRALHSAPVYLTPAGSASDAQLESLFDTIATDADTAHNTQITLHDRPIGVRKRSGETIWFNYGALCTGPRGTADYVDLARCFHTVIVSGVPQFDAYHEAEAQRFINLVDEFYDRGVKLIMSAATPPQQLYIGKRLAFAFQRTCSRLIEMQSREYLAAPKAV